MSILSFARLNWKRRMLSEELCGTASAPTDDFRHSARIPISRGYIPSGHGLYAMSCREPDYKSVLVKGFLKSASAHHIFYGEVISSKTLDISHYKWFAGSIDRLKAAHELVIKAGEAWAIEYQRVLDHYDKHGRFAWEKFGGE